MPKGWTARGVAEAVAVFGVIASLVFVGYEIRQNTIVNRAAAYQAIGLATSLDWIEVSMDPEYSRLMSQMFDSTRWHEIEEPGWDQIFYRLVGALRAYETVYLQYSEGLLPVEAVERLGFGARWSQEAHFLRLWPELSPWIGEEFRRYLVDQVGFPEP